MKTQGGGLMNKEKHIEFVDSCRRKFNSFTGKVMHNVSGGAASAYVWWFLLQCFGSDRVDPVFADTTDEDPSTYTFLDQCESVFGQKLTRLKQYDKDGRPMGIWDCFEEHGVVRIMGAGGACKASVELKQKPLDAHFKNSDSDITSVGLCPHTEPERCVRLLKKKPALFPLSVLPPLQYCSMLEKLKALGLSPPEAYEVGAPHNNCLAKNCILSGLGQWAAFLERYPERYREVEERSNKFFEEKGFSVLRDRRGGTTKNYTLTQLREDVERGRTFRHGWVSNCSCMDPLEGSD